MHASEENRATLNYAVDSVDKVTGWLKDEVVRDLPSSSPKLVVAQPVLMYNMSGEDGSCLPRQRAHADKPPGEKGFSVIFPCAKMSFLVAVGSHNLTEMVGLFTDPKTGKLAMTNTESAGKWYMSRLHLKPGQVLVMDGHTIHAGDRGLKGVYAPRMHVYILDGQEVQQDETWIVSAFAGKLAGNLIDPF